MNGGIYFIKKNYLKNLKYKMKSFENDFILNLIKEKKVSGIKFDGKFIDIGTPRNLKFAKKILLNLIQMSNNKIYVSGFDDAQLLITLKLISQYCTKNNITDVILDSDVHDISPFLRKTKEYKNFKSKFNIIKFKEIKKNNLVNLFFYLIINFFKIIKISTNLNRKKLLEKNKLV